MGLQPIKNLHGAPYNSAVNLYYMDAADTTAAFIHDAVVSTGEATAEGIPIVRQAAAGEAIRGSLISVAPVTADSTLYREASTGRFVHVEDAPDAIYVIAEDGDTSTLTAADIGSNVDLVVNPGSTFSGISGMLIDSSSVTTLAATFRLLRPHPIQGNVIGQAGTLWEVIANEHELKQPTGV